MSAFGNMHRIQNYPNLQYSPSFSCLSFDTSVPQSRMKIYTIYCSRLILISESSGTDCSFRLQLFVESLFTACGSCLYAHVPVSEPAG